MSLARIAAADALDDTTGYGKLGRCGTPMVGSPSDALAPAIYRAAAQRVIYLNRFGGTYSLAAAPSNSATNTANRVVSQGGVSTATIAPMATTFNWATIVTCVKKHYEPYNVRIVESEPVAGIYTEAVVGGNGSELGFPASAGILGIAATTNVCSITEAGIAFSFSEPHKQIAQPDSELCATIAHEVGHLLALEHETLAKDVMSYVPFASSNGKLFVDLAASCGTSPNQSQPCACTSDTTNSASRLGMFIGARPVETTKPSLGVASPKNGDTVAPGFDLVASASDDQGMGDVRVVVDGVELGNAQTETDGKWRVKVKGAPLGPHTFTIISRDLAGNETSGTLMLTVEKAALGEVCDANDACTSSLCAATADGSKFCTQVCNPAQADSCPSDFTCSAAGTTAYCVPDPSSGCGCQSNDPRDAAGALFVLGLGTLVARRRRAAHPAAARRST